MFPEVDRLKDMFHAAQNSFPVSKCDVCKEDSGDAEVNVCCMCLLNYHADCMDTLFEHAGHMVELASDASTIKWPRPMLKTSGSQSLLFHGTC